VKLAPQNRKLMSAGFAHNFAAVTFLASLALFASASTMPAAKNVQSPSIKDLEKAANSAREKGDAQGSMKLYERALARNPSWQEGWWYYSSLLYDGNKYAAAVTAFRKLVQLNDKLGNGWAMLGLSEFEVQDYNGASVDLQNAERLGTDDSLQKITDYHLAVLLNQHGDSDGASLLLSALYLKGVRSEDLQVALGLSLLRVPVLPTEVDPSHDALVHDAGNLASLLATKQTEKAEVGYREMLSKYPNVQFLHYGYGALLASGGHDAEAQAQFKAETELNPESVLAYLEWAFVTMKAKEYPEAIRLARRAGELNASSFLAHYILGNSLLLSGDPKAALPELETAKKLAPGSPDIRYSLSRTYARLSNPVLAREEQAEFIRLQRKNAVDRLALQKRYPGAQAITGVRPTTLQ
jgi:tetratricopeptide (TPR) repeat protein